MSIDIFTFLVQIFNFLLLLFILKKFLYKPIAKIVHDRQEYIKNTIEAAESKLKYAESKNEMYQTEINNIEVYRTEHRNRIDQELTTYKSMQIERINGEMDDKKTWLTKQFEAERNVLLGEIVKNICIGAGDFMMNVFSSLTNNSLENSMLDSFFDEINNFSSELIDRINKNIIDDIIFISSFELNSSQKALAEKTFKKKGIIYRNVNFAVDREIGMGNQIITGSLTVNSNVKNIVDQFKTKLEQTV